MESLLRRRDGVVAQIVDALQIRLDDKGLIDWDLWCIDGANVRATRAAAPWRRSRGICRRP